VLDDGIATGSTMIAALRAVRARHRAKLIAATGFAGNLIALLAIVLHPSASFRPSPQTALLKRSRSALLAVVIGIACALAGYAQGSTAGRPDFSGTWTFDTYLSDHPEQIAREIRIDTGQPEEDVLAGLRTERGGFGGAGRDAGGRATEGGQGRGQGERADQMNADDRKKLTELTDAVQFAPPTLTIAQADNTVTIAGARGGTGILSTNGKAEKQQLGAGAVDRVARWEGPTLVVSYEVGHAGTLTYTYLLVPTTRQLLIRVNFERVPGEPGPFDIKLVYNRARPAISGTTSTEGKPVIDATRP